MDKIGLPKQENEIGLKSIYIMNPKQNPIYKCISKRCGWEGSNYNKVPTKKNGDAGTSLPITASNSYQIKCPICGNHLMDK